MFVDRPEFAVLLNAVRGRPHDGHRCLALAAWRTDTDRVDEAAVVQML